MKGMTYITKSGRHVGVMPGLGDVWITGYLDKATHGGRLRCNQVPTANTPEWAQVELNKYATAHGWEPAGMREMMRDD